MNWNTNEKPVENKPDIKEDLELAPRCRICIDYSPFKMVWLGITLPCNVERKIIDVNDRDGTRRMVLRELLPLAEAALVALRNAVAESTPAPSGEGQASIDYSLGREPSDDCHKEDCHVDADV